MMHKGSNYWFCKLDQRNTTKLIKYPPKPAKILQIKIQLSIRTNTYNIKSSSVRGHFFIATSLIPDQKAGMPEKPCSKCNRLGACFSRLQINVR
jgi:hypothetical protein